MIVTKFGGSSLADAAQFKKVKTILDMDSERKYVVPSAPGKRGPGDDKITDLLYAAHKAAQEKKPYKHLLERIQARYEEIAGELNVDMDFKEEFVGETFGRINKAEADLLLEHLLAYIDRIGSKRIIDERIDFGIISPYKAQVQYLRSKVKNTTAFHPFRSLISINTVDGFHSINTVDGFQGQERDVILISLVRANEQGEIGFLRDLRRMNVAITRARMKLIIFGDAQTLGHHPFYKKLQNSLKEL